MYFAIKHIHLTAIAASFLFFTFRFILRLVGSSFQNKKWVRIVPHVVDTILLLSAVVLMIMISQYPLAHMWLTVKLACVIGYIFMGLVCLKHTHKKAVMIGAYAIAVGFIAVAGKIAVTKQVPFL